MRAAYVALAILFSLATATAEQPANPAPVPPGKAASAPKKPVVRWHAPLQRELPAARHDLTIPIDLESAASVAVREVTSGARQLDRSLVNGVTIASDGPQHVLRLLLDPVATAESRTYNVRVLVLPQDAQFEQSTLELVITRVAAQVEVVSPVRLERVAHWIGPDRWKGGKLAVTEAGKSPLTLHGRSLLVQGKTADNVPFQFPMREAAEKPTGRIDEGSSFWIEPAGAVELPLGMVTGTLSLQSKQLAAPVPVTVEVRSRRPYSWLFTLLVASIGIGYITRTYLEGKRAAYASREAAVPLWEEMDALSRRIREPEIAKKLRAIRAVLFAAWDGGTAAKIDTAAANARKDLDALSKTIAEETKAAAERVNGLRAVIGEPGQQSGALRTAAEDVGRERKALDDELRNGWFRRAAERAEELENALPGRMAKHLAVWRNDVEAVADALAGWKGVDAPDMKAVAAMKSATLADVAATMKAAAEVSTTLNAAAYSAMRSVDVVLRRTDLTAQTRAAIARGRSELAAAQQRFYDDPRDVVAPLATLRPLLEKIEPSDADMGEPESIGQEGRPRHATDDALNVHIESYDSEVIGRPMRIEAAVTRGGAPVPGPMLRWYVDGRLARRGRKGELTFTFVPESTRAVTIHAEMLGNEANRLSNVCVVKPLPSQLFDRAELARRQSRITTIQTVVFGAVIVAIGCGIFLKSWIGDFTNVLMVFLWGFSSDIGLNKILDLTKPIQKLAPAFVLPSGASAAGDAADEQEQPPAPAPAKEPDAPAPAKEPDAPAPAKKPDAAPSAKPATKPERGPGEKPAEEPAEEPVAEPEEGGEETAGKPKN